jgi:hypothetical protein
MEHDALRLDTLELTLKELQARYEQVQEMLSGPAGIRATSGSGSATSTATSPQASAPGRVPPQSR